MIEGSYTMDDLPPEPHRWWITRKLRAWLIRIKDLLIYQTGMYPSAHYSIHHRLWVDGMLKGQRQGGGNKWTDRWDAFLERWEKL